MTTAADHARTGMPSAGSTCTGIAAESDHCITCADEGTAMTVVRVDPSRGLALCQDDRSARATVETALVEPVTPGDTLLVHAGTAIAQLRSSGVASR